MEEYQAILLRLTTIALLVCIASTGYAQEKQELKGQNIELEISATRVKQDYERLLAALKAEQKDFEIIGCDFLGSPNYRCISLTKTTRTEHGGFTMTSKDGIQYYVSPFPLTLPYKIPEDSRAVFHWVPITEAVNGRERLSQWQELSRIGSFFDCVNATCSVLVRGVSKEIDQLAACSISVVNSQIGAPSGCRPIAVTTLEGTWVRVVAGFEKGGSQSRGLPDFDLVINFQNRPIASSVISATLAAAQQALANAPLSLTTTVLPRSALGVAAYRVSPILTSYRELITLRVDVSRFDERRINSSISELGLVVSSTLYVNRLNTTRPEDWHLPSPQQEQAYADRFKAILKMSLESICRTARWTDDVNLNCESR